MFGVRNADPIHAINLRIGADGDTGKVNIPDRVVCCFQRSGGWLIDKLLNA